MTYICINNNGYINNNNLKTKKMRLVKTDDTDYRIWIEAKDESDAEIFAQDSIDNGEVEGFEDMEAGAAQDVTEFFKEDVREIGNSVFVVPFS